MIELGVEVLSRSETLSLAGVDTLDPLDYHEL
jgi:hypothetical protein